MLLKKKKFKLKRRLKYESGIDLERAFLHKKKRRAIIYFVSTKNNTVATIIDMVTKKTLLVYSTGQSCEVVETDSEEEKKEFPKGSVLKIVVKKGKKKLEDLTEAEKMKKTGRHKGGAKRRGKKNKKKKEKDAAKKASTSDKKPALGRAYRKSYQSGLVFGNELFKRFEEFLLLYKEKYGISLKYRFFIYFKGRSRQRRMILREFLQKRRKVLLLGDITQIPHNGCRAKKVARTKKKKKPTKPRLKRKSKKLVKKKAPVLKN